MSDPFKDPTIRDWFFAQDDCGDGFPDEIVTMGSGPFEEEDFDGFLEGKGVSVCAPSGNLGVLAIGREDWDEDELDAYIETRRGQELRVYSQEMLLSFLATNEDPYDSKGVLLAFGEGHPALEHLEEWGFIWKEGTIVPGIGGEVPIDPPIKVGLLKHLGYEVGRNGLNPLARQRILTRVFGEVVPNVVSTEYMAEWGTPGSSMRLQKLASSIASFAGLAKRRRDPPKEAIRDWETDLGWLKDSFYHGRFTFHWPSTHVQP